MDARSRKNHSAILHGLGRVGQVNVAKQLNVSETTISRYKDHDSQRCASILASCELKVVPEDMHCYSEEYINHLHYFAQIGMKAAPDSIKSLEWDDE